MRFIAVCLVITGLGGCESGHVRECEIAAHCQQADPTGMCVSSPDSGRSFCAFAATDCASGYRWGALAGDDLADDCVTTLGGADAGPDGATTTDGGTPDAAGCSFGEMRPCGTDIGDCEIGTQSCEATGTWGACEDGVSPAVEVCGGGDEDCDGTTDNGLNACGGACTLAGVPGAACDGADGDMCTEGTWSCSGPNDLSCSDTTTNTVEACNGADDDCDGALDEGCACIDGSMQTCGSSVGACELGTQMCIGGMWDLCAGGTGPMIETCNDIDDDCNSMTDETFPSKGMACTAGMGACTTAGVLVCSADGSGVVCDAVPGAPALEMCNGSDDDCDGAADEGCPATPVGRFPWNGYSTGSVWATGAGPTVKPRRPTFRWEAVMGATSYDLQVDDTCTTPGFAACAFPSPELAATPTGTVYTAAVDLSVSTAVPVGRRYYWRVRACNMVGCSGWTPVRYLDVGRQSNDFNGDGYADFIIGASDQSNGTTDIGKAFVYHGSSTGVAATPTLTLANPLTAPNGEFGAAVASAGDVNGDGFADAIVGAYNNDDDIGSTNEGKAYVYYGSFTGLTVTPSVTMDNPLDYSNGFFGSAVQSAGDVNGDGYADVVVAAQNQLVSGTLGAGQVFLFVGSPAGLADTPAVTLSNPAGGTSAAANAWFGHSLGSAGDVNGDGYVDVIVGAPYQDSPASDEGNAFLYLGSAGGLATTPTFTLDNPTNEPGASFGFAVATAGDPNDDGFADVVVGAPLQDVTATDRGQAFVYAGGPAGTPTTPTAMITSTSSQATAYFGWSVSAAGHVTSDTYSDLICGANYADATEVDEGNSFFYGGGATGVVPMAYRVLDNPADLAGGKFGAAVAGVGDVNGDGYDDVVVGAPFQSAGSSAEGNAFLYLGASANLPATPSVTFDNPTAGQPDAHFGEAVGGR